MPKRRSWRWALTSAAESITPSSVATRPEFLKNVWPTDWPCRQFVVGCDRRDWRGVRDRGSVGTLAGWLIGSGNGCSRDSGRVAGVGDRFTDDGPQIARDRDAAFGRGLLHGAAIVFRHAKM